MASSRSVGPLLAGHAMAREILAQEPSAWVGVDATRSVSCRSSEDRDCAGTTADGVILLRGLASRTRHRLRPAIERQAMRLSIRLGHVSGTALAPQVLLRC
jgi:hypothetical protein